MGGNGRKNVRFFESLLKISRFSDVPKHSRCASPQGFLQLRVSGAAHLAASRTAGARIAAPRGSVSTRFEKNSGHQIFRGFFSHCERREKVSAILLGSLRSVSKGFLTRRNGRKNVRFFACLPKDSGACARFWSLFCAAAAGLF